MGHIVLVEVAMDVRSTAGLREGDVEFLKDTQSEGSFRRRVG